jgi:asparaginyl-tRNA synthetase
MSTKDFTTASPSIEHLQKHIQETVTLRGWVANKREGKGIVFIILRDSTGFCQCVVTAETSSELDLAAAQSVSLETSVILKGVVKADEKQVGGVELQVTSVEVVGVSERVPDTEKVEQLLEVGDADAEPEREAVPQAL